MTTCSSYLVASARSAPHVPHSPSIGTILSKYGEAWKAYTHAVASSRVASLQPSTSQNMYEWKSSSFSFVPRVALQNSMNAGR